MKDNPTNKSPYDDWLVIDICPKIASLTMAETVRPPRSDENK